MERYNYYEVIEQDVKEWLDNHKDVVEHYKTQESLEAHLNDELWAEDSVTGNASGSYFCNAWLAEEAICHNLDYLKDMELVMGKLNDYSAESIDVSIRCYLLDECIHNVLESDDFQEYWHDTHPDEWDDEEEEEDDDAINNY